MLAAFLYATHINNIPLLIAGPLGRDIAESLSVSLYATEAGKLTLGNEYYKGFWGWCLLFHFVFGLPRARHQTAREVLNTIMFRG